MDSSFQVVWAHAAESDLKEMIEYSFQDRPQAALNSLRKIKEKASKLYNHPERGRIVPELQDQGVLLYRELVIPPWRLIYKTLDRTVIVLSIIDSRQNVEDILLKRIIRRG